MNKTVGIIGRTAGAVAMAVMTAMGCHEASSIAPMSKANAGPFAAGTIKQDAVDARARMQRDGSGSLSLDETRKRYEPRDFGKSTSAVAPMASARPGPFAPGGAAIGGGRGFGGGGYASMKSGAGMDDEAEDGPDPSQPGNVPFAGRGHQTNARRPAMAWRDGHAAMQNPDLYIANTYLGGTGARDRLEMLVREGVLVDGKRVRLESFSRSYAQTFPIPTRTALHVTADTERSRIVQEGDHTYLQVGLQAIKGELPRRPPLNIALVIDRSGSMADEQKLEFAKASALRLVDDLRSDDIFSLAVFDDDVQLLVPAQHPVDRANIKRKIATVQPGGGTNIYAGLKTAYSEAARFARPDTVNRVILLSDGQVTAGVTDPQAFRRLTSLHADKEIQTTSVGLGLDFNEELMMAIARDGRGNYHFIKNGADTRTVFAKELDELTHVVAKAVKLRIHLADGVGLVRVLGAATLDAAQTRQVKSREKKIDRRAAEELGIAANRQTDRDEPGIKLLIPDFYRGDSHVVMIEVAVPKGLGRCKIADVFLKYKDLVSRSNQAEQSAVSIQYTPNRADMVASINRAVKKNLLGFQTGEALADAGGLIARGDPRSAIKRVDERMVVVGLAAREWSDRDLDRDGQLLSRYEAVIRQLSRSPELAQSDLGQYVARSLTYTGYKMTR